MRDDLQKLATLLRTRADELDKRKMTKAAQFVQAATGLGLLAKKIRGN